MDTLKTLDLKSVKKTIVKPSALLSAQCSKTHFSKHFRICRSEANDKFCSLILYPIFECCAAEKMKDSEPGFWTRKRNSSLVKCLNARGNIFPFFAAPGNDTKMPTLMKEGSFLYLGCKESKWKRMATSFVWNETSVCRSSDKQKQINHDMLKVWTWFPLPKLLLTVFCHHVQRFTINGRPPLFPTHRLLKFSLGWVGE